MDDLVHGVIQRNTQYNVLSNVFGHDRLWLSVAQNMRSRHVTGEAIMATTPETLERRTLSLEEAARALGIGRTLAYELAQAGRFPARTIRVGRKYRVSTSDLDRVIDGDDRDGQDAA